jgi:hypothetical protein
LRLLDGLALLNRNAAGSDAARIELESASRGQAQRVLRHRQVDGMLMTQVSIAELRTVPVQRDVCGCLRFASLWSR